MATVLARYATQHPKLFSKFSGFKMPTFGGGGGSGLFSRFGGGGGGGGVNAVGGGGEANIGGSVNTVGSGGGANAGPTLTNRIKAYKPTNTHIGISVAVVVIVVVLIIVLAVVLTRGSGSSTTTPAPLTPLAQMTMASLPTTPAMTLPSVTVPASTVLPSISPTTLAPTPGVAMAPQTVQSQTINVSPLTTSEPFPVNMFQVTSGRSAAWQGPSIPITAGQPYTIQTSVFLWNNATSSIDTTTPFVVTLAYTPPGGSVQYTWLMPNQKSGLITIAGSCPASSSQPIIYIDTVPIGIDSIVSQYNNNNTSSTSPWVPSGCQLGPISSTMATAIQTWASQNKIK